MSNVNHPAYYNMGKIEVIDAIEDWKLGFHAGNVVKYVARSPHKRDELEDLEKAQWYLTRLIEKIKAQRAAVARELTVAVVPAEAIQTDGARAYYREMGVHEPQPPAEKQAAPSKGVAGLVTDFMGRAFPSAD